MMINEAKAVHEDDLRELRVKIPAELYRMLHSMRVLRGVAIRDIVEDALVEHFRARGLAHHGEPDARATASAGANE